MEGWRDFSACVNVGKCTMGPLVHGGGRNILVPCICRTSFQCPDVEVGLRFQYPCGGGGGGGCGRWWWGGSREILEKYLDGK